MAKVEFWVILVNLCLYINYGEQAGDCECECAASTLPVTRVGAKRYYVETNSLANWYEAMNFCSLHKMRLASITSDIENEDLKHHLGTIRAGKIALWTSGNDLAVKNNWYWSGIGTRIVYTSWYPREPNHDNEHCIECYIKNDTLFWNNNVCGAPRYFICET